MVVLIYLMVYHTFFCPNSYYIEQPRIFLNLMQMVIWKGFRAFLFRFLKVSPVVPMNKCIYSETKIDAFRIQQYAFLF